ncbi:cytochrome P450 [Xylariaceae sp. FL0804]|nr:cytochrome P450 [Xylariaceae sp. FL0804]
MHERYGPIVRINPWEVHIRDSSWNAVYKYSARSSKPAWFYLRFFGRFPSTNSAESHALHQLRRAPLQAYFASANIQRYLPTIRAQVDKLCARLEAAAAAAAPAEPRGGGGMGGGVRRMSDGKGREGYEDADEDEKMPVGENVVSLSDAFRCLATDVATGFAFGRPFGHLDEPTFDREFNLSVRTVVKVSMWSRHAFGLMLPLLHRMPEGLARRMNPAFGRVKWMFGKSMNKPEPAPGNPPDMIQTILASSLPPEEQTFTRLFSETRSVIMAGTETTASVLVCITAQLLREPAQMEALARELGAAEAAKGAALEYADLREMPYITGVINEGLRLANPTPSRLPRVCEDQDLQYGKWVIPRGTTISTTVQDVHTDAALFPDPLAFRPERWAASDDRRHLGRHLLPWGRGSRLCLGAELATADAYLAVLRLFRPAAAFRLRPENPDDDDDTGNGGICDVDWQNYHDFFAGFPRGSRGLRVRVVGAPAAEGA